MTNSDFNKFLETLTEEQKAAVLACKTEDELEKVIDDYDIELTDEMLADVAGGKGFFQAVIASVMVFTTTGAVVSGAMGENLTTDTAITASALDGDDIVDIEKKAGNLAVDKVMDLFGEKVPVVGAILKGPLTSLLKDALGLNDEETPAPSISDLSDQISDLSKQMTTMEKDLKDHMEKQTLQLINEINNQQTLAAYKEGINALSVGGNSKLRELAELNSSIADYNDDEKLFIIANVIGNSSDWDTKGNTVYYLKEVGGYMMGKNYFSEKDFYTALCDSGVLQQDYLFYDEVQSAAVPYINYMMKDYLAAYTITCQSLQAQKTIIDAIDHNDKEAFNPDNLRPSLKKIFDAFSSAPTKINSTINELTDILYGGGDENADCIVNSYDSFCKYGRTEYINEGKESTNLVFETKTVTGSADTFTNIYKNNYLTGDTLQKVLNNANSADMTVAEYLKAHNNPLPEGAKYLLVAEADKEKTQRLRNYGPSNNDYEDRIYDEITVIDVNDITQKHQTICVAEHKYCRQYGIGYSDWNYDYKNTPVGVIVIKEQIKDTKNPFGNMSESVYKLKSGAYKLGKDCYINGSLVIESGVDVTIDLAGYTLNRNLSAAKSYGAAIIVRGGGKLRVIDSTGTRAGRITGGYSDSHAGGINVWAGAEAELDGITVSGNKAAQNGGAIYSDGKVTINNCVIENNEAYSCGGVFNNGGTLNITDTTFTKNVSTKWGGGALQNHASAVLENVTFEENSTNTYGGAVWTGGDYSSLTATNVVFNNNKSDIDGGAFYLSASKYGYKCGAVLESCTFTNNYCKCGGGAIHADDQSYYTSNYELTVNNCLIADNEAGGNGGGLALRYTAAKKHPTITNTTITRNKALSGGGLYSFDERGINVENCTISENSVVNGGGGLAFEGVHNTSYIKNTNIIGNTSGVNGSALWSHSSVSLENCEIANNVTQGDGTLFTHSYLTLKKCEVHDNTADFGGGLYIAECLEKKGTSNHAYIYGGHFYNNTANSGSAIFWKSNDGSKSYNLYNNAKIYGNVYSESRGSAYIETAEVFNPKSKQTISYNAHCEGKGWMAAVTSIDGDEATAGTEGEGKRMEAFRVTLNNPDGTSAVTYRANAQDKGWLDWQNSGGIAGTEGQSLRVEALEIKLTGELAEKYDVVYRAHCEGIGWTDWVKNGETAGTQGQNKRVEAIQIKLVIKLQPGTNKPNR